MQTVRRAIYNLLPIGVRREVTDWWVSHRRGTYSQRHLSGEGLEIGAMHFPLPVRPGVKVRYVDHASPDENLRRFGEEVRRREQVRPDYLEDGFELPSIRAETQDFLIASHVLEHSPNPIKALETWWRVLRPGGVLFLVVPIYDRCFDRGRKLTSLEHMIDDRRLCAEGMAEEFERRNLDHYREWLSISTPNAARAAGEIPEVLSNEEITARALAAARAGDEIHFHTFSVQSFSELLQYVASRAGGRILELADLRGEVVGVLLKPDAAHPLRGLPG
jgi:SAM-dependent methyltransferase